MKFTPEHDALRRTTKQFVDSQINPFVDEWEEAGIFPAHELFRKMAKLGLLGVCKPEENGGMGLDYSYNMVVTEELGKINCGGVPMAIGVQTDMATPALARFGSKELRDEFLTPAIAGEYVASIAVSEPHAGSAGQASGGQEDHRPRRPYRVCRPHGKGRCGYRIIGPAAVSQ